MNTNEYFNLLYTAPSHSIKTTLMGQYISAITFIVKLNSFTYFIHHHQSLQVDNVAYCFYRLAHKKWNKHGLAAIGHSEALSIKSVIAAWCGQGLNTF